MHRKLSLQTWTQNHLLTKKDVAFLYGKGMFMYEKLQKKIQKNHRIFLAGLFVCGFIIGIFLKVITRESVMIGYQDYAITADYNENIFE